MRDHVPEFVDLMEQFTATDKNAIQAYALKVGDQVIVKEGQFDQPKDTRLKPMPRRWG
jgi:protein involved in polysaccharide export with SLBB domain